MTTSAAGTDAPNVSHVWRAFRSACRTFWVLGSTNVRRDRDVCPPGGTTESHVPAPPELPPLDARTTPRAPENARTELPCSSVKLSELRDAHVALAAGRIHADNVARFRSHERARDRRLRAELARLEVLLGGADDRERLLPAGGFVHERDRRAECDDVAGGRRVHHA